MGRGRAGRWHLVKGKVIGGAVGGQRLLSICHSPDLQLIFGSGHPAEVFVNVKGRRIAKRTTAGMDGFRGIWVRVHTGVAVREEMQESRSVRKPLRTAQNLERLRAELVEASYLRIG